MNIYEIIRRWHSGQTISGIANALNLDRKTVHGYIQNARKMGIARDTALPGEADLLASRDPAGPANPD